MILGLTACSVGENPADAGIGLSGNLGEASETVGESGHQTSGSSSTSQSTWSGPETAEMEDELGETEASTTSTGQGTEDVTTSSATGSDEQEDEGTQELSGSDSEATSETDADTTTTTDTESTEAESTDASTDDGTSETTSEDTTSEDTSDEDTTTEDSTEDSSTTDTESDTTDTSTSETETTGDECVPTWCIDDNAGQPASGDKILATAQHGIRIDIDRDMEIYQIDLYAGNGTPLDLTQNIRGHNDSGLIGDILATAAFPITTTPGYHPAVYDPPLQVSAGDVIWISWDALINMDAPVAVSGTMRTFAWENPPGQWATFQRSSLLRVACCEL